MPHFTTGSRAGITRGRAVLVAWLVLAALFAIGPAASRRSGPSDEWATLIETGDALAAVGGRASLPVAGRDGLTARSAYLLAFHHAQDAMSVERALVAAARLERLGEHALAAHARHVAATLAPSSDPGR